MLLKGIGECFSSDSRESWVNKAKNGWMSGQFTWERQNYKRIKFGYRKVKDKLD